MGKRWFVVETWSSREASAGVAIAKLGFRVSIPMAYRYQRDGRWYVPEEDGPLFPGYIFVLFDPRDIGANWGRIMDEERKAKGVIGVIRNTIGDPIPMRYKTIRAIRTRGRRPEKRVATSRFKKGQEVRITEGPFTGFAGLFDVSAQKRVKVLLNLFGRETTIEIEEKHLQAAA